MYCLSHCIDSWREWEEISNITDCFDEFTFGGQCVVVACSGGSDSMLALVRTARLLREKDGGFERLIIVHCNHKTRQECDMEEKFVKDFCDVGQFVSFAYSGKDFSENALRKWRWYCLEEICGQVKGFGVVTGHHFDDHVETSLVHLYRGCGLVGLSNMERVDWKYMEGLVEEVAVIQSEYAGSSSDLVACGGSDDIKYIGWNGGKIFRPKKIVILRPLLALKKKEIREMCKKYNIDFIEDESNLDDGMSQRNRMRIHVLGGSGEGGRQSSSLDSIQGLYDSVSVYKNRLRGLYRFAWLPVSQFRQVTWCCRVLVKRELIDVDMLICMLSDLGKYRNASTGQLLELLWFVREAQNGYKYYQGLCVFVSHQCLYFFAGPDRFWELAIALKEEIASIGVVSFGDFCFDVGESAVGETMRFAHSGEQFHDKSVSHYLREHQIPLFWRRMVPVIEKKGYISAILIEGIIHRLTQFLE